MIKKTSIFKFYISEIIKFLSATSKVIICHFESKISEFEKEITIEMSAIFKFYISEIKKFICVTLDCPRM